MSYYQHRFTGRLAIHRVGHYRYRVVFLPPELAAELPFDAHPRLRMDGEIGDVPVQAAWQPAGTNASRGYYVMVSPAVCRAAGLAVGDEVEVRFNVADPDAVVVPEELQAALAAHVRARAAWERLTPGRLRGLAARVASPRLAATRERRAGEIVDGLLGRGPLPGPPSAARRATRSGAG